MGKALADLKRHDQAFAQLTKANALKRRQIDYDKVGRLAMFDNIRTTFT